MTPEEQDALVLEIQTYVAGLPEGTGDDEGSLLGSATLARQWWDSIKGNACACTVEPPSLNFFCCLPRGHQGPHVGWTLDGQFQVQDRLRWGSSLQRHLETRQWESTP